MKTKITLTYTIGHCLRVDIDEYLLIVLEKYPHFLNPQIDSENDSLSFIIDTDQLPDLNEFQELNMDRSGHWWNSFSDLHHMMVYLERFPYEIYDLAYAAKKEPPAFKRCHWDPNDLTFEISEIEILKEPETTDS